MEILSRVRRTIREHQLAQPTTRVLIALSGGSDSVALLHLLRELDHAGELSIAGLAHFNHQLRQAADHDQKFCSDLAQTLQLTLLTDSDDVAARARREHVSIEQAAREARYEFLDRARRSLNADVVALGHTRDDQAETFLLRLVRGAGLKGLAAMHPRRGAFVRPLLDCRRAELQEYLRARDIFYVADESNDDVGIPRNRVRAELVPLLQGRFNPAIVDTLAEEAEIAREEWQWMAQLAGDLSSRICRREGDIWRIDAHALNEAPRPLARMVVHELMTGAARGRTISGRRVDEVLLVSRGLAGPLDAPGHRVERDGDFLVLTSRPADVVGRWNPENRANLFSFPLSIPGRVHVPHSSCIVSAEMLASAENAIVSNDVTSTVRLAGCEGPLIVRNRRPGDRFRPLGVGGSKKLQDYFVDRKVAREERDRVPLVVDGTGRIMWVAGHAIDEDFRVTDPAQAVLILRLTRVDA
jgi:tRNA(Ile)-lysidine synthase